MKLKKQALYSLVIFLTACHFKQTHISIHSVPEKASVEIFTYCASKKNYTRTHEYKTPADFYLNNDKKCKSKIIVGKEQYLSKTMQINHSLLKSQKIKKEINIKLVKIRNTKDIFINNFNNWLPEIREKIKRGEYAFGMTKEHILFSLGKPVYVNRINYAWEEWSYIGKERKEFHLFFKGNNLIKIEKHK